MSFITQLKQLRELELARRRPCLTFLPFSASQLLATIHAELFPDVDCEVRLFFVTSGPLSCIARDDDFAAICIHQLLNHSDTPREVMSHIFKHELLHLRIPSMTKNGKVVQHTPEFWEAEQSLCPECQDVWTWVWFNHSLCLRRRKRLERIDVRVNWKKFWGHPKTDVATCASMFASKHQKTEECGAGEPSDPVDFVQNQQYDEAQLYRKRYGASRL
jgi:hypothetical protein